MKNDLGIEIKCENCMLRDCGTCEIAPCKKDENKSFFMPSTPALHARIEELTAFVEKFLSSSEYGLIEGGLHNEARELLESEASK